MENTELDNLGILRQTKVPHELDWMTDDEKRFMLVLLDAGEFGLLKRQVLKELKTQPDLAMRLSAHGLADWGTDRHGKESFFALSNKGEEIAGMLLRIARNASVASLRELKAQDSVGAHAG
jgi:hypothetical protein